MKLLVLKLFSLIVFIVAIYTLMETGIATGILAIGCWLSTLWLHENPNALTQDFNAQDKTISWLGVISAITLFTGVFLMMLEILFQIDF